MNQRVEAMDMMIETQAPHAVTAAVRRRDDWLYWLVLGVAFLPLYAGAAASRLSAPRGGAPRSPLREAAHDVRNAISVALMEW